MSVDRILQLKLIADVGDINRKMTQTSKSVGKVQSAVAKIKPLAKMMALDLALQGLNALKGAFDEQLQHAQDLRNALEGLEAVGKSMGLPEGKIRRVADRLRDIGVSLGVGEDAKIVSALRDIAAVSGKIGQSQKGVEAVFDVMRTFDQDFDTAKGWVINGIFLGRSRYMDQMGLSADTAAGRLAEFNEKFGDAAEEFAQTAEGKWQVAGAEWDGHMLNLAIVADGALLDLKGVLVTGWNNLTDIIDGIAAVWDGVHERWLGPLAETVAGIGTELEPIAGFLKDLLIGPVLVAVGTLSGIWKLLTGDVKGAMDQLVYIVRVAANIIVNLLNALSAAFAFDASFEIPSFEIPDPTQLLEGGTIKIGGGTVDLSRGRLFPVIKPFAEGGIVTSPTLAMVGEAGPEAVIPLDRVGSAPAGPVTINVYAAAASPADVGRSVVEAIEAYERRSGSAWRAA